jgi:DNA-binding MarR family transcriptional regulator
MSKYDCLKLENQLCFPLYACSKAVISHYKPLLDKFDLTYTQYITMMVMWERKKINVKELGKCLYLDSGTMTPVLKKLEAKEYLKKYRSEEDERSVIVELTEKGKKLKGKIVSVPEAMGSCVALSEKDAKDLYRILYTILNHFDETDGAEK